jgi:Mn2+/Fe2+ NRAMP family transporter
VKIFGVLLGVLTAVGGFIEIGDLVFLGQAGAVFGYETLWAIVVGLVGIMVYAEMSGRVAAVSHRPVFDLIRERLGFGFGAMTLVAGQLVTLLTLAAEIGGVAIVLQLLFDLPAPLLIGVAGVVFLFLIWVMSFEMIERVFSLMGLGLLLFIVAALKGHPDWSAVGHGVIPNWDTSELALYGYFAVGIIAAMFMPYEIYFYSSGGIEEGWNRPDARLNKATVLFGFTLGGVLAFAILMSSAQLLKPNGIQPDLLGTVALGVQEPLGEAGLLIALIGMLFAIGGATAETALSGAYNVAQFFGWEWGKYKKPRGAPRFTLTWMTMIVIGTLIIITGIDPVQVTEFAVIFSVVALPLSYLPVLLVANDRTYMQDQVNGPFANVLGWLYLGVIVIAALAAIPLMIITNMGKG